MAAPATLSQSVRCSAVTQKGKRCNAWAVNGLTVCRQHGGKHPANQVKSTVMLAARRHLFVEKVPVSPSAAMLDIIQWTAGEVEFWREKVRELEMDDPDSLTWSTTEYTAGTERGEYTNVETQKATPHIAYRMLQNAQDRLVKYSDIAIRAGIEERRVRLAEKQGDLLAEVIRKVLGALNLTPEQQALVPEVVPRELRAIAIDSNTAA